MEHSPTSNAAPSSQSQQDAFYRATLAELAHRYEDMIPHVNLLASSKTELALDELDLVSTAYKRVTAKLRFSRLVLLSREQNALQRGKRVDVTIIGAYRRQIERELATICNDVIHVLGDHLIPSAASAQAQVVCGKMMGDYQRYLAEITIDEERTTRADAALAAYRTASDIAVKKLLPTDPLRLGLALNFSVFYHEILDSSEKACHIAKKAFDDAHDDLDTLSQEAYYETTQLMTLLSDNLLTWMPNLL